MFKEHASVSQERIYHTDTEAADQTFYLTQSQYTDTRPTIPSANPLTPDAWQSSHYPVVWLTVGAPL